MLKLRGGHVGIPRFPWREAPASAFLLSSHRRAREALDLALAIDAPGYNVFVLGEDRTGRMSATMTYLRSLGREPAGGARDWVYLYNFQEEAAPQAFQLHAGDGRRFAEAMDKLLWRTRTMLEAALNSEGHRERVSALYRDVDERLATAYGKRQRGRDRARAAGAKPTRRRPLAPPRPGGAPDATLDRIERETAQLRTAADERRTALDRQTLATILDDEFPPLAGAFAEYGDLRQWLDEFRKDLLAHVDVLAQSDADDEGNVRVLERYRVNLLVDHAPADGGVVVEANPTYDNLFGRIEYKRVEGVAETSFLLIRPGALHRANGGILVLRAEALTRDETAWRFLKAALRDREIRIEELHRVGSMPITGLPRPQPIPLQVKVVIVGSRDSYFRFFAEDSEFHAHFKVKADIEADMEASDNNLAHLGSLIQSMAIAHGASCTREAVSLLLGLASRFAGRRDLVTSRFELLEDLLCEATQFAGGRRPLPPDAIYAAWQALQRRNGRAEQRFFDSIRRGHVAIATKGMAVGQINALTVRDVGEHRFGRPSRVTARASIGRRGLVNIERIAELGGRIQQKGALVVEGYLRGIFGQRHPVSFDCSITFEQNYGGVDGDSASVAELLAILSTLSEVPLRQDLAVTGSFNQHGEVQAVGDLIEKIEGFFRATEIERVAGLRHGVVLPAANVADLVLDDDVTAAVEAGVFDIWGVAHVEEAVDLLCVTDPSNQRPSQTVFAVAASTLARFDAMLWEREVRPRTTALT